MSSVTAETDAGGCQGLAGFPTETGFRPRTILSRFPKEDRDRVREGIVYCLKVFVGTRIGLLLLGFIGVALITSFPPAIDSGWPVRPVPDPGWHAMFTAWERFDALWYLKIATFGYSPNGPSSWFFPLYPLITRAVSWGIGWHPYAASLIVSNSAFLAAICLLYFLTMSEFSRDMARKTVLYISIFPTAFFFFAPYTESLFLLATVASLWAARRGRWGLAGVAGMLASLTRLPGLILVPALAVEALHQRGGWRRVLPRLVWSASAATGTAMYLGFWWWRVGDPFYGLRQAPKWLRVIRPPWVSLTDATRVAFTHPGMYPDGLYFIELIVVLLALVAAAFATRRVRPSLAVFAWLSLLVPLSSEVTIEPLVGMARYVLPIFPLFWGLAIAVEDGRIPNSAVIAIEAAGLGVLTILFVNWGIN
jgi:hypothetical protein